MISQTFKGMLEEQNKAAAVLYYLDFEETSLQYGSASTDALFDHGTNDFCIWGSSYLESTPASIYNLFDCRSASQGYLVWHTGTGYRALVRINSSNYIVSEIAYTTTAEWRQWYMNVDRSGNMTFEVLGVGSNTVSISAASANTISPGTTLEVCRRHPNYGGGAEFDGRTRMFGMKTNALMSAGEITAFTSDHTSTPASPTCLWDHTDGSGTTLTDTANAKNISLVNTPVWGTL